MARPSTVRRQVPEVREAISLWHGEGRTLDEILAALEEAYGVKLSRSALHRYVKGQDKVMERVERSRQLAREIVARYGGESDDVQTIGNLELIHAAINAIAAAADPETGDPVVAGPMDAMLMAKALDHLLKARVNAERVAKARAEAAPAAAGGYSGEGGTLEIVFVEPQKPAEASPGASGTAET
jgi:hypothetical protein